MRNALALLLLMMSQQIHTADADPAQAMLTTLPGSWDGTAIETPVGKLDYAMNFHPCSEGVVAGVADPGAALHYWRFWQFDGELRLTFLTTFRGNQEPTQLVVNKIEASTVWFYAPELALLTVSVTLDEPYVDLRVFHHGKPHVYIRLTRLDKPMTASERAESLARSCKTLN